MTTLTPDAMRTLHGSEFWRPPRGAVCGLLAGSIFGFAFTGQFVAAAIIYMVTPSACFIDFAL